MGRQCKLTEKLSEERFKLCLVRKETASSDSSSSRTVSVNIMGSDSNVCYGFLRYFGNSIFDRIHVCTEQKVFVCDISNITFNSTVIHMYDSSSVLFSLV